MLLEEARVAAGKEAGELRAGLQEVERSRLEARRELQELRRQVPSHRTLPGHLLFGLGPVAPQFLESSLPYM